MFLEKLWVLYLDLKSQAPWFLTRKKSRRDWCRIP